MFHDQPLTVLFAILRNKRGLKRGQTSISANMSTIASPLTCTDIPDSVAEVGYHRGLYVPVVFCQKSTTMS